MNTFIDRAIWVIKNQTGAELIECKIAFDKTRSIKNAIQYIHMSHWRKR